MDGMTLLAEARAAGLIVLSDGDRLVIRGLRSAEAIARRLLAHKADVMKALVDEPAACHSHIDMAAPVVESGQDDMTTTEVLVPTVEFDEDVTLPPCPTCGSSDLWETILGTWHCQHVTQQPLLRSRSWAERRRHGCGSNTYGNGRPPKSSLVGVLALQHA